VSLTLSLKKIFVGLLNLLADPGASFLGGILGIIAQVLLLFKIIAPGLFGRLDGTLEIEGDLRSRRDRLGAVCASKHTFGGQVGLWRVGGGRTRGIGGGTSGGSGSILCLRERRDEKEA